MYLLKVPKVSHKNDYDELRSGRMQAHATRRRRCTTVCRSVEERRVHRQGLTLVHFSAQREHFLGIRLPRGVTRCPSCRVSCPLYKGGQVPIIGVTSVGKVAQLS